MGRSSAFYMHDFIVIGGGIVGLSTAYELQTRYRHKRVLLLEKEPQLAAHQSGRNSGVIHAGVYYAPGSLKAQFCQQGLKDTLAFCQRHGIAYEQCGKLLVATSAQELERMDALERRCADNGIATERLSQQALREREPNVTGLGALYVQETGIADYPAICRKLAELLQAAGGEVRLGAQVERVVEGDTQVVIHVRDALSLRSNTISAQYVVACAGLQADRLLAKTSLDQGRDIHQHFTLPDFQIVPFRGEYYRLPVHLSDLVNHLIYPIPDPDLPFLGVHLTRMIDGSVTVGPNAVLGFKREGYGRWNLSIADCWSLLKFAGFAPLLLNNWRSGMVEIKDAWWRRGYLKRIQKYCPQLRLKDLQPYPTGIRAQAVLADGSLVHDFLFAQSARTLHVCNAPSPAATSSAPIAAYICDQLSGLVSAGELS